MAPSANIGIDFGTSNSVVAVVHQGRAEVLRNADGHDITPSIVGVNAHGELLVGEPAARLALLEERDTAEGFKRQLGDNYSVTFPSTNSSYSPTDLASFVLADLRRTASDFLGDNTSTGVITIPAEFGELEKAALIDAGIRAGFSNVTLIQEPIAAGLAYGWDNESSLPWLVYDIGAGTFDLSVIQVIEKQLVVRAHRGVKALGGRDIDSLILDNLIIPRLSANVDDSELSLRRRILRKISEDAKIRLSRADTVVVPLTDAQLRDAKGNIVTEVIPLSRSDILPFILEIVDKTLPLIGEVLDEANLNQKDVSSILLVGGPSKIPALRQRLQESFSIPLETSVDPLSVVAQGAAYHAVTLPVVAPKTRTSPAGVTVRIEYNKVATSVSSPVGVVLDPPEQLADPSLRVMRADKTWETGWIKLTGGAAIFEVIVGTDLENEFIIELIDNQGDRVADVQPNSFTILSKGVAAAAPPLSMPIGVMVEGSTDDSPLSFSVIAEKGAATPLTARKSYRTTRNVPSNEEGAILEVHFRQGESQFPFRNRAIGNVTIRGSELPRNLPRDSEVRITLRVDPASKATASVFIPALEITLEEKLEQPPDDVSDDELLMRLEEGTRRVEEFDLPAGEEGPYRNMTQSIHAELLHAQLGDSDSRARAKQTLSQLEESLDELQHSLGPQVAAKQLEDHAELAENIIDAYGEAIHQDRLRILQEQRQSLDINEESKVSALSASYLRLAAEVWFQQPEAWIDRFRRQVSSNEVPLPDSHRVRELVEQGMDAIKKEDLDALKMIVIELEESGVSADESVFGRFGGLKAT